ncbi:hypothetical protein Tco_1046636 [Tanacetum coccineum]
MNFSMIKNLTYSIFISLVLFAILLMTVKILNNQFRTRAKYFFFNSVCSTNKDDWEILFQPMFDEYLNPSPSVDLQVPTIITPEPVVSTDIPSSTTIDPDAPSTSTSQTTPETPSSVISLGVEEADHDIKVAYMDNNPFV